MDEQQKALYESVIDDQNTRIHELKQLLIDLYMSIHVSEFNDRFKYRDGIKNVWLEGKKLRENQISWIEEE